MLSSASRWGLSICMYSGESGDAVDWLSLLLCLCRYMLALLSIFRYVNIIHKNSSFSRWMETHRTVSVLICAMVSLSWSVPPLFDVGNAYTAEGFGFHCSLDWNNSAFHSRLFVYSLLICNYFLLLFVLIYSNLRVYFVLRHLLKINKRLNASLIPTILRLSIANINSAACVIVKSNLQPELRKRISDRQIRRRLGRLERLKLDRRYARITGIMVTQFVIAWTPYAILATIIITGHMDWARNYPILSTISELLAKFSLILNPLILIFTSRMRQHWTTAVLNLTDNKSLLMLFGQSSTRRNIHSSDSLSRSRTRVHRCQGLLSLIFDKSRKQEKRHSNAHLSSDDESTKDVKLAGRKKKEHTLLVIKSKSSRISLITGITRNCLIELKRHSYERSKVAFDAWSASLQRKIERGKEENMTCHFSVLSDRSSDFTHPSLSKDRSW